MAGVYGYGVHSDRPLTRLRPGEHDRGSIAVRLGPEDLLSEPAEIVSLVQGRNDEPVFAVARTQSSLLTWCQATGSARIDAAAGQVWVRPKGDPDAWENRLLNTLIPLLLAQRGELMLHAAAVQTGAGAVVVCGPSGRGKSTLAAVVGAQGLPILAEDEIALTVQDGHALAWPGPSGVRLHPEAAQALGHPASAFGRGKEMHRHPAAPSASGPVPVAAIVALDPRGGSEVEITALDAPAGLAAIFLGVARLELGTWPESFRRTAELVRRVPCHAARLPDDLGRVAELAPQLIAEVTRETRRA